jgi:hypothetical protein
MDNGMSVSDALAMRNNGNNDGTFGGNGAWVFFLFFLLAWGGGFGGLGGNNAAAQGALTRADLCQDLNFQNVENGVRGIQQGLCDGFYSQNTTMLQGFNGVQRDMCSGFNGVVSTVNQGFNATNQNINNLGYQMQSCCCETNRNIDSLRYENAKNTCDIIAAGQANTQRIVDVMTQNTIQELRDQLQAAQLQLGNNAQTNTIINAVRPISQPAYITCSPYESINPYATAYSSCACGN